MKSKICISPMLCPVLVGGGRLGLGDGDLLGKGDGVILGRGAGLATVTIWALAAIKAPYEL